MNDRLRLLIIVALLGSFGLFAWRGLGDAFRERGRYADALGLVPAASTPLTFAVPSLTELALRYSLGREQATCALCHIGSERSSRFNAFGESYRAVVRGKLDEITLPDSPETRSIFQLNIAQIREAIAEVTKDGLDSDRDGYDNDLELLFGFRPGDPASKPALGVRAANTYRDRLREAARDGRLESLLRQGVPDTDAGAFFGFRPGETPLVRPERLALYRRALER